jgi:predicted transcriptional regulator of viral defense system
MTFPKIIGIYTKDSMKARLKQVKRDVEKVFKTSGTSVFLKRDITHILSEHREEWDLPKSVGLTKFINFLLAETALNPIELVSKDYASEERFVWGNPSVYAIALSLRKNAYLTHGSAVFMHGLTDEIPKTVYVNYEQSAKNPPAGKLTQEGIDRAFANRQRQSKLIYDYDSYQIVILSGKHTGRLEVSAMKGNGNELLDVTKLERTLIDITVRPAYAGGVVQVLEAFKAAKDKISANTLVATLKKLDYIYPYQQAIGFYMERAGYSEQQWSRLLKLKSSFDFYLAHGLPAKKKYDERWGLYYPDIF